MELIIITIVFALIQAALITAFVLYVREVHKKEAKYINALISKTPKDMAQLDLADKFKIAQASNPNQPPDLVPVENLSDEEFEQHIQDTLKK